MISLVSRLSNLLPVVLSVLLAIGLIDSIVLTYQYWWPGRIFDGSTSGVWTALAFDFAQGHLYRPIVSDVGYGGTRYMPVFFMLHGGLIRLGLDPVAAGVLAMQAGLVSMLSGIFLVLVHVGVSRRTAAALALVTLCTTIFQQYMTDTNCDYLAAAFGLFALALYLMVTEAGPTERRTGLLAVALLSVLAFCTKFTAIYVPASVFLHLVLNKRFSDAILFVVSGLVMVTVLLAIFHVASGGLMWENVS
jgi:hypothetical protein